MFRYWPRAGSRMLKATQPRAGTRRVATRAALLSLVALTTVSAACTIESSAWAEPAAKRAELAAPRVARCCALCKTGNGVSGVLLVLYSEDEGKIKRECDQAEHVIPQMPSLSISARQPLEARMLLLLNGPDMQVLS